MLNQSAISHDFTAKSGVSHAGPVKEGLNLFQQLSVRHDLHGHEGYHKFPTPQAQILGIYEMATSAVTWDIPNMAAKSDKKESARLSALSIAAQLAQNPHPISERQWTIDAGVSPSFFSNLRGTPTKPPSDPSVDQLRKVLRVRGISLAEFFLPEAHGRIAKALTKLALEQALADIWEGLPKSKDRQIAFVAENILRALELPETESSTQVGDSKDAASARVK